MRFNTRNRRGPAPVRIKLILLSVLLTVSALTLTGRFGRLVPTAEAVSTTIVISQFQVAGGSASDEFVELHNVSGANFDLNGHRVVYRSATGVSDAVTIASWTTSTIIPAGGYYLIAATLYDGTPAADRTYTATLAAGGGGIAIRNGAVDTGTIIDSVGYGTATNAFVETTVETPAPAANASAARLNNGCTDTDNNANDFATVNPSTPRNSATTAFVCGAASPALTINDVAQAEGNSGTTNFTFTVSLSPANASQSVTVNYATANGTTNPATGGADCATAGVDYVATSGTLTFVANDTSEQITVQVCGETISESNETFFVNLSAATNATISDTQGLGTISNDDVAVTPIYNIQGSGTSSPLTGQSVSTSGIVTARRSNGASNNGFYIQDPSGDGNLNTSDAILVFTGSTVPTVAVGDSVQVTGTIVEFESSTTDEPDGVSPPDPKTATEITGPTISLLTAGNTLPAALDAASLNIFDPAAASRGAQLEKYEYMRISVPSLTVSQPSNGFGEFWGVETPRPRPFREPGIERGDPVPAADEGLHAGSPPPNVPIFDGNFERITVDSGAALMPGGATRRTQLQVTTGTVVTGIVGPLDYAFDSYRIVLDFNASTGVSGGIAAAVPVPARAGGEFTIGHTNLENFSSSNATKMSKASLAIRNVLRTPDILGLIEVDTAASATALANKINADAADPNVNYFAFFGETSGSQDIGYLVNIARVTVVGTPEQYNASANFVFCGVTDTKLHDRPAFILTANVPQTGGGTIPVTVILNHTKSLIAVDSPRPYGTCGTGTEGARNREKRRLQAEDIADLIETRNAAGENLVVLGDLNAFEFNDGLYDVLATLQGTPPPPDQVVEPSTDRWDHQLTNLLTKLTPDQRYSFTFEGNAQTLDHVLVNHRMLARNNRFAYARFNADFSDSFAADSTRPEGVSDHDAPVAYFTLSAVAQPGQLLINEFRHFGPNGPEDEFVEIYNNTDMEHIVVATDGSAGYSVSTAAAQTAGTPHCVIPNGTRIPARGYFLCVNSDGYSLASYPSGTSRNATADATFTNDIPINAGLALFSTANTANFSEGTRLDAAGPASEANAPLYKEGSGYPEITVVVTTRQYSYFRDLRVGVPKDTNDNAADFLYVNTDGVNDGAGGRLGAPGPQNLSSPILRNQIIKASLIDPNCEGLGIAVASTTPGASPDGTPVTGCQNTARDFTPLLATQPQTSASGTFYIRRRFRNNTMQNVTRLRFRVVDITSTPQTGTADLRLLSSGAVTYTVGSDPNPVTVQGLTLEELNAAPPSQPNGGGFNSSAQCCTAAPGVTGSRTISLAEPLAPNGTIDLQFRFGVMATGAYRFFINVEAETQPVPLMNVTPSKAGAKEIKR